MKWANLKNLFASVDRFLGYWFYFRLCTWLQPKSKLHYYNKSSENFIADVYAGEPWGNKRVKAYHNSFFEASMKSLKGGVLLDTSIGWIFYKKLVPVMESFPYSAYPWKSFLKPTLFWSQAKNLINQPIGEYNQAVNLVWYAWANYYHFMLDVVPILHKICHENLENLPILVPAKSPKIPFVKDVIASHPSFGHLNLHEVEPGQTLKIEEVIVLKEARYSEGGILNCPELVLKDYKQIVGSGIEKLFLYRPTGSLRSILNLGEVVELMSVKGFECIDTSNMSLETQVRYFTDVKLCVGVHGAGLTNLLFCRDHFTLLELNANKAYLPDHYEILTRMKGGTFKRLLGSSPNTSFQFTVDVRKLEDVLDKIEG